MIINMAAHTVPNDRVTCANNYWCSLLLKSSAAPAIADPCMHVMGAYQIIIHKLAIQVRAHARTRTDIRTRTRALNVSRQVNFFN